MSIRKPIAALAAVFLALLQGCQESQSIASSGDRSSEGNGMVAFRLSQKSLDLLKLDGASFQIAVAGPGMRADTTYQPIDTLAYAFDIPCGTRYVQVAVVDSAGHQTWSGRDTVEVDPGQPAWAHITLRRSKPQTGNIVIDIDLDNGWIDTLPYPPDNDTVWFDSVVNYPVDSTPYCYQGPGYFNDSGTIYCTRLVYRPTNPFGADTLWVDSVVNYPVDSSAYCYPRTWGDTGTTCTRLVYRPYFDTRLCGMTVVESPTSTRIYNCLSETPVKPPKHHGGRGKRDDDGSRNNGSIDDGIKVLPL